MELGEVMIEPGGCDTGPDRWPHSILALTLGQSSEWSIGTARLGDADPV
jgi:hypothetical protein